LSLDDETFVICADRIFRYRRRDLRVGPERRLRAVSI
jgi:hypothetical protein